MVESQKRANQDWQQVVGLITGHSMKLYHFTTREYGLKNIRHRRLKIARINELNDPFEFLGVASTSATVRKRYSALKSGLSDYMGVLCFSESWHNPVQWSHYAEHHKGLCLCFEIDENVHDIRKVNYVERRLKAKPGHLDGYSPKAIKHMLEILTTKFLHWQYEQEHRVFPKLDAPEGSGLYFFKFENGLILKEVIIGHRSTVTRSELREALGSHAASVKCTKARLAFQTFGVVAQKKSALWK